MLISLLIINCKETFLKHPVSLFIHHLNHICVLCCSVMNQCINQLLNLVMCDFIAKLLERINSLVAKEKSSQRCQLLITDLTKYSSKPIKQHQNFKYEYNKEARQHERERERERNVCRPYEGVGKDKFIAVKERELKHREIIGKKDQAEGGRSL